MGIKAFPIAIIAIAILIASLSVAFSDYLLTNIIGTNNTPSNVASAGYAFKLNTPPLATEKNISIHICNATRGCFPLVADVAKAPTSVRIPIGYPSGPATISISEHVTKKQLYSAPIVIQ